MSSTSNHQQSLSLIEVIVAVAMFMIFASSVLTAAFYVRSNYDASENRLEARYLLQEGVDAVRSIRDYDWAGIAEGTYGLSAGGGYWTFSGTGDTVDIFTRSIEITNSGISRYDAVVTVTWLSDNGTQVSRSSTIRITNWASFALSFLVDLQSEFDAGYLNSVVVTSTGSAQLQLTKNFAVSKSAAYEDLEGAGVVTDIAFDRNEIYMVSSANATGPEIFKYDVNNVTASATGGMTLLNTVEVGQDLNDILLHDGYGYICNSGPNEVITFRLLDEQGLGGWDVPSGADANEAAINGTGLAVVTTNGAAGELYVFDNTNPEGSAIVSLTVSLGVNGNAVQVDEGYYFVGTSDDSQELRVYSTTGFLANSFNLSGAGDVQSMLIDPDNNIIYITRAQAVGPEFAAVSYTSPTGTLSLAGSNDTFDDNADKIAIDSGFAYLATAGVEDAVEVIQLSDYSLLTSINVPGDSTRGIAFYGNLLYVGTNGSLSELHVLEANTTGWTNASIVDSENLTNATDATRTFATEDGYLYVTRNVDAGTSEFFIYKIEEDGTIGSASGSINFGYTVNDIFVLNNFAYLATADNAKEMVIVDVSTKTSPVEAGSFNASGTVDAQAIYARYTSTGTQALLGTLTNTGANPEFYNINVTNPASTTLHFSTNPNYAVFDITGTGYYAFSANSSDAAELIFFDISNPGAVSSIRQYNHAGSADALGVAWDADYNRLHITFENGGTTSDYEILDITAGTGIDDAFDFNDSHRSVVLDTINKIAFIASDKASSELIVVDYEFIQGAVQVASFSLSADASGVAYYNGAVYIAGENDSQEIQVVKAGTATGTWYGKFGIYTSQIFDSGSTTTVWDTLDWTPVTGTGEIKFQTRTSNSTGAMQDAIWVGPGGTSTTYYTATGTSVDLSYTSSGSQYFQFATYFSGSGDMSPELQDVTVTYSQ